MKRIFIFLILSGSILAVKAQSTGDFIAYYSKGEINKAFEVSSALISGDTENALNNQLHGRVLADMGRYAEAVPYLEKAIITDGNKTDISAWAHGYLGQCYFVLGRYSDSEKSLKDCVNLNLTRNSRIYAQKRLFLYGFDEYFSDWKIIETENIRFHIQLPENIRNLEHYIALREKAFKKIQAELGTTIPKKTDFFIWDNADEPKEKFDISLGFADPSIASVYTHKNQTVGHEITHVISHYLSPNPVRTGFINEGLAVYFDMRKGDKFRALEEAVKNGGYKDLKIEDFWLNWQKYPDTISYPLAGAFLELLINKYGISELKPLLANQSLENAQKLFGPDLDILIKDFEKKIASI